MSRFDPKPDTPYAVCADCDTVLPTREEMSAHLSETRPSGGGRSHRAQITNQTRIERIEGELSDLAEEALSDFVDKALDLEREGVTEEEITEALRSVTAHFDDAWANRDA